VGFALPDPRSEAALEEEQRRMQREKGARTLRIKAKTAMEEERAQNAVKREMEMAEVIKQAKDKFTKAARKHAEKIRPCPIFSVKPPDIVPYEALHDPMTPEESPYPWRDQVPKPRYMFSLAQEAPAQQHVQEHADKPTAFLSHRAHKDR